MAMTENYISAVYSPKAPKPVGPYSQAVRTGGLLFISGQLPIDPETGDMVTGDIEVQTTRVLDNIAGILHEAGAAFRDIVKTTVFIADMSLFQRSNQVYSEYFNASGCTVFPARSTVQAARLPKDAAIEIEAIAVIKR